MPHFATQSSSSMTSHHNMRNSYPRQSKATVQKHSGMTSHCATHLPQTADSAHFAKFEAYDVTGFIAVSADDVRHNVDVFI